MMNLDCAVDGFRAKIPVLKPELFLPQNLREIVVTDDEAVIKYTLPEPVDIDLFMDYLEDELGLIMLFHFVPSDSTSYGQSCCAYVKPGSDPLYKINATVSGSGSVSRFTVTLYVDLEIMLSRLLDNVKLYEGKGCMRYCRREAEVIMDFIRVLH